KLVALPDEAAWTAFDNKIVRKYARDFDEWILLEDVKKAVNETKDFLAKKGAIGDPNAGDLLREPDTAFSGFLDSVRSVAGREKPTFHSRLREKLEERHDELMKDRVKRLNWELQDRAAGALMQYILEEAVARARAQK